ncbi:Ultraviolet-B receptor like [Actinidia chinensis var. chinensis]|uniref:Ultraviolet-B receptor like n=1 Tax=Actinidia chinensis var. chinensis TaxID=1590841 RepID=A0A2R6PS24_ACTCC|nr:Ultraviolet-B receptor like [Actinidia chinensis var. chinensis]
MADIQRTSFGERDAEQAIKALKRGAYLLKYGRTGKPKFCPFRLSPVFQRYPRPEKEYQSFSLVYNNRSLDLICKDKDEAEIWFVALRALISRGHCQKWRNEARSSSVSSDSSSVHTQRNSPSVFSTSSSDTVYKDQGITETVRKTPVPFDNPPQKLLGRAFSDLLAYNAAQCYPQRQSVASSVNSLSSAGLDNADGHCSADNIRISSSSAISSLSQGSSLEDFDGIGDVFIWGEGICYGLLGGGTHRLGQSLTTQMDAVLPKALESTIMLDAQNIACGSKHAVLVTKQGEIFSWGEGLGGRLGHGVEVEVSNPKLISALSGLDTELVACGEYHTCAVTLSGDLYTWGDGTHNFGLLGHGSEAGRWTPRKVCGQMEGMHVTCISCGPWHTAAVTMGGQLFTFGQGTFAALGHGDRNSTSTPREVKTLNGLRTVKVACGFWHTAAVAEVITESANSGSSTKKLFTWGDGDKGQLGHGDKQSRLVPSCVAFLEDTNLCQVACGHSITIALTTSGRVYTMGSADYGQLGNPGSAFKLPTCVEGKIKNNFIEEISCGSHHVAVLSSKSEVYTWGKGANGQLGHGDNNDRNTPTLVEALRDKRVKNIVCGSNFTTAICLRKWVCHADNSVCSGCRNPFNFRRKRHNCYNCGLVFCKACCSQKSLKASLAPNVKKPYRVCDDCFAKLKMTMESGSTCRIPRIPSGNTHYNSSEVEEKETLDSKPHSLLSRLSSFDSFKRASNRISKQNRKSDSNNGHTSSINSVSVQCGCSYTSTVLVSSVTPPGSRVYSQAASPVSITSSPPHSMSLASAFYPKVMLDDSLQKNDGLVEEMAILSLQVEDLTRKYQLLESELQITSRQLKEATKLAREEAEKNKAAQEIIKSLTSQLDDMGQRAPQDSSPCIKSNLFVGTASSTLSPSSSCSRFTNNKFLDPSMAAS